MTVDPKILAKLEQEPDKIKERKTDFGAVKYLEAWMVIDQLNETFGYDGWSFDIDRLDLDPTGQFYVCRAMLRVKALDISRSDVGVSSIAKKRDAEASPDAHDTAIKGAVSDCLKRCARTLGKRFGNELYEKEKKDEQGQSEGSAVRSRVFPPRPSKPVEASAEAQPAPKQESKETPKVNGTPKINGDAAPAPRLAPEPKLDETPEKQELCEVCGVNLLAAPFRGWFLQKRKIDANFPALCAPHWNEKKAGS